jgi:hypothetical protein
MNRINIGGVVKGGLLAGLIMNVSEAILNIPVAGARMEAELKALNLAPPGGGAIALFTAVTFLLGLLTIYVYAAIRPRFGPGPKTAVVAGLIVWALAYFYSGIFFGALGINSWGLVSLAWVWTLAECTIAAVAGASLYKE